MASVNTSATTHEFSGGNSEVFSVGTSGNAEDFTWSVEYTLDLGTTWSSYKDGLGDYLFTGSDSKVVRLLSEKNRVNLTSMGSATSVLIEATK
tara:strand:- start:219 stop:497 length:279 start_codon:yes stop_codon:yes gene_type:complete